MTDRMPTEPARVPVREIAAYFLRLGLLGFGGPVALVGQMERELVADRGWLGKSEMRDAIAVCQSLPGPLAIQVGIFIAYLRGGFRGRGQAAGPSFCRTSSSSRHLQHSMSPSMACHG